MHDILDLEAYPINQPHSAAYADLVTRCQHELVANGMFTLGGFMRQSAIADTLAMTLPKFETQAFHHERKHNIYFKDIIPGVPDDSILYTEFSTSNLTLCADQVTQSPVLTLYEWQPFIDFLAEVMKRPALYQMADPLARLNVMAYHDGQGLNWHFDRAEFTTTLLLQAPVEGGEFLYRTNLRSADDPNYDAVALLVRGDDSDVQTLDVTAGALNVFRGVNTPHRVTPTKGKRPRVVSVFTYFEANGVMFSKEDQLGFYGRTA